MSDFGERIYELRNKNNMSQGDLADRLEVSRQTVSKWENSMCKPEADKLIQLSEIFNVSIDYILKGEQTPLDPVYVYVKDTDGETKNNEQVVRKYVGIVLAIVFAVLSLLSVLFRGGVLTVIPATVMLLGILLAKNVKHPYLITFWVAFVIVVAFLPFISSVPFFNIFNPIIYTEGYTEHFLLVYGQWLLFALLIFFTVRAKKSKK
ncbi:MAG: helix-turn-helix transcriptional regulator [Clostridia bacterium]|nr:helix-turn-helix transcriptional regulator [Clostridia bacterium]